MCWLYGYSNFLFWKSIMTDFILFLFFPWCRFLHKWHRYLWWICTHVGCTFTDWGSSRSRYEASRKCVVCLQAQPCYWGNHAQFPVSKKEHLYDWLLWMIFHLASFRVTDNLRLAWWCGMPTGRWSWTDIWTVWQSEVVSLLNFVFLGAYFWFH